MVVIKVVVNLAESILGAIDVGKVQSDVKRLSVVGSVEPQQIITERIYGEAWILERKIGCRIGNTVVAVADSQGCTAIRRPRDCSMCGCRHSSPQRIADRVHLA